MEALLESLASHAALNVESPPAQFNFASHLFRINQSRADKLAYIDDAGATTYGQLEDRARRCASALHSLGIRPEERLLLVMLDTVELPIAFLGALYAGVVPVVVNTLLTSSDYAYMLTHSRARAVIASGAVLPTVAQGLTDAEHNGCILIVSQPADAELPSERLFTKLIEHATPAENAVSSSGDDIAFWLYSSGSTGRPKGTVHTHANLYWTAELYAKPILGITVQDVVFSAAKIFFAYGLGNALTFQSMPRTDLRRMRERLRCMALRIMSVELC